MTCGTKGCIISYHLKRAMGIKFLCENCEKKIHVKDFLAGRRAKCPHCNTSIRIPDASTITGDIAQTDQPATDEPTGIDVETASKSKADVGAAVVTKTKDRSSRSKQEKADISPRQEALSDTKSSSAKPSTAAAVAKMENPAPKVEAATAAAPNPAPTQTAPANDPFAEAGNAMWYVAPPSGGQYGPADSKLLQSWIAEGRVSADSLVWREGWADWKSASVVMQVPNAPAVPPPTGAETASSATNGSAAASANADSIVEPAEKKQTAKTAKADKSSVIRYHRAHQRSRGLGIMLVAALAIVSVALVVVLIFVLKMNS